MAKLFFIRIGKVTVVVMALYAIYALVSSTIAHAIPARVGDKNARALDEIDYRGQLSAKSDRVALIETPEQALGIRIELLRSARESIDFVCHTIANGSSTDAFFAELADAAERGVDIRIVVDGKFGGLAKEVQASLAALDSYTNVELRRYNPLNLLFPWQWHTLLHDKFIIVDHSLLLLGGRNLGDRYFAPDGFDAALVDDREALVWGLAGEDSVLPQAEAYMQQLWDDELSRPYPARRVNIAAERQRLAAANTAFIAANPRFYMASIYDYLDLTIPAAKITLIHNPIHAGQKEPWVGYSLAGLIAQAEQQVVIQTPYSTANRFLLDTLEQAAQQVPVLLLTNSMAGSPNYPAYSNYFYNRERFVDTGVTIYEYQSEDSIHGKSMIFDQRLSAVGSFNLDDRSMFIDTETMLVIDSPAFAAVLADAMGQFFTCSLAVGEDNAYLDGGPVEPAPVPAAKRLLMWFASIPSRLLQFLF